MELIKYKRVLRWGLKRQRSIESERAELRNFQRVELSEYERWKLIV